MNIAINAMFIKCFSICIFILAFIVNPSMSSFAQQPYRTKAIEEQLNTNGANPTASSFAIDAIEEQFNPNGANSSADIKKSKTEKNSKINIDVQKQSVPGYKFVAEGKAENVGKYYSTESRKIALFPRLDKCMTIVKDKNLSKSEFMLEIKKNAQGMEANEEGIIQDEIFRFFNIKKQDRLSVLETSLKNLLKSEKTKKVGYVYINEETAEEVSLSGKIMVCAKNKDNKEDLIIFARGLNLTFLDSPKGSDDQFLFEYDGGLTDDVLSICEKLKEKSYVKWASPDFIFQLKLDFIPNDPMFNQEWHHRNTAQSGGVSDADIDADDAWDATTGGGSSNIVVAIVDSGVQTTHPDLTIFVNQAESAGSPGVDDDGNGYIDDINGWDFYSNDNNPNPGSTRGHGTCCAGVAAARGNNSLGVAGAAYNCTILPVKIQSDTGTFSSSTVIGNAIRYAANMAHVQSNSWGGGGDDAIIHTAIQYAVNTINKPVFFSSGNDADGTNDSPAVTRFSLSGFPNGTFTFKWEYTKNGSVSAGDDTVWLDDVTFPGGAIERFEGTFPPDGWTTGGDANWTQYGESRHAYGTGMRSAQAGAITHSQTTYLQTTRTITAGTLIYYAWVSSEAGNDIFNVDIGGSNYLSKSGVPIVYYDVAYPARYSECIAVGASTDFDYRSLYSQYDETLPQTLDIVCPSNGGNWGIATTDITGAGGYNTGDYTNANDSTAFGGTSSACPLAAGSAALLLSKNASLNPTQIKDYLTSTADKIGGVTYTNGYNRYYGYGRINLNAALLAVVIDTTPPTCTVSGPASPTKTSPITFSISFSESVTGLTAGEIVVTNGTKGALSGSGSGPYTLPVTPTAQDVVTCQVPAGSAQDAAGNWSTSGSYALTFDTTPPTAPSVSGPASPTNDNTPTWTWTAGGGGNGTFRYKLDDSDLSSGATQTTSLDWTPGSALSDGLHTLYVQERDAAGNWSASGSYALTVVTSHTVAFQTDGTPGASLTGTTLQTVNHGDNCTSVTANAPISHHFVKWTLEPGGADYSITNPLTVTNVTQDMTLIANYAINTYTLTYTAGAGGTIDGTSPQTVDYGANGTEVTAVPDTGYHFVKWSDDVMTASRTDLNVTVNITVTAIFAINTYTLTYTAGANGTTSGTSPQTVDYGGSGTPVTAVPDTGYHFVNWDDGFTSNPRTDTDVIADISVTSIFDINESLGITVNPATWNIGPVPLNDHLTSGPFTLQNTGNVAETFTIQATDGATSWTLGDNTGQNTFKAEVAKDDNGSYKTLTKSPQELYTNVSSEGTKNIGLRYNSPTGDTVGGGKPQDFTIILTASRY